MHEGENVTTQRAVTPSRLGERRCSGGSRSCAPSAGVHDSSQQAALLHTDPYRDHEEKTMVEMTPSKVHHPAPVQRLAPGLRRQVWKQPTDEQELAGLIDAAVEIVRAPQTAEKSDAESIAIPQNQGWDVTPCAQRSKRRRKSDNASSIRGTSRWKRKGCSARTMPYALRFNTKPTAWRQRAGNRRPARQDRTNGAAEPVWQHHWIFIPVIAICKNNANWRHRQRGKPTGPTARLRSRIQASSARPAQKEK